VLRKGNWTRNKYTQLFRLIKTISRNFRFAVLKRKCVGRSFFNEYKSFLYVPSIKMGENSIDCFVVYFKTLSLRLSSDRVIYNVKDFKVLGLGDI